MLNTDDFMVFFTETRERALQQIAYAAQQTPPRDIVAIHLQSDATSTGTLFYKGEETPLTDTSFPNISGKVAKALTCLSLAPHAQYDIRAAIAIIEQKLGTPDQKRHKSWNM